jgi:hypothetical protein
MPVFDFWWLRGYHTGSVLPRIAGKRIGNEMRLTIDRTGTAEMWGMGCGFAIFFFGVILALNDLIHGGKNAGSDIQMLLLGGALYAALMKIVQRRRFRKGTLILRPWPIRLGTEVDAKLNAFVRNEASVTQVGATIECIEEATKGMGKNKERKASPVFSLDLPPSPRHRNRKVLSAAWTFNLPPECPASFQVRGKRLQWRLVTTIPTDAGETSAAFDLLVVPEVAR